MRLHHAEAPQGQRGRSCGASPTSSSTSSSPTGSCEFISAYAQPFAMLVVADLLGVPEEDHQRFREGFGLSSTLGEVGAGAERQRGREPARLARRRSSPSTSRTAGASPARTCSPTWPWPPTPTARSRRSTYVVRTATFLFAAGQETTARLLAAAAQAPRRAPRAAGRSCATTTSRIPNFLEEVLRVESPVKTDFRLARQHHHRRRRRHQGRHAGDAAQRRRQPRPPPLRVPRTSSASTGRTPRRHIAFGRGAHSCPGGPLARAEGRISLERILDRMHDIRLSEEHHGPAGDRRFELRADLDPAGPHQAAPRVRRRSEAPREPRRRRHRWRLRHRPRRGPAASSPTATASPSSTATARAPRRPPTSSPPAGGTALAVEVDVADRASVDAAFDAGARPSSARSRSW